MFQQDPTGHKEETASCGHTAKSTNTKWTCVLVVGQSPKADIWVELDMIGTLMYWSYLS